MLLNRIDGRTESKPEEIEITPEMIEAGAIELFSWEASGDAECMRAVFIAISKRSKSSGVGLLGKTDNAALAWLIDLALPILPASAIQSGEYMVRMQRLFWADEGN